MFRLIRLGVLGVLAPFIIVQAVQSLHDAERWDLPDSNVWQARGLVVFTSLIAAWVYWSLFRAITRVR